MSESKTKKALIGSAGALVLCFALLLGTTFAWFTDNASTKVNKIQAGNLDVALEMKDANGTWVSAEGKTLNFVNEDGDTELLWEPGATYELPELRIVNKGNLALKYKVEITGIDGDAKLNDAIDWYYSVELSSAIPGATGWTTPTDAYKLESFGDENYLYPEGTVANARTHEQVFKIVGVMDKDADNEYQGLCINSVSITVYATQFTYENDISGNQYDKDATYDTTVSTAVASADELAAQLTSDAEAIDVVLTEDIALDIVKLGQQVGGSGQYRLGGTNTKSIDIDLGGNKLTINTDYWSALGANNPDATITIKNGSMNSSQGTGTWNSYDLTFYDCNWNFKNVTFDKAVAISTGADTTMTDVIINESNDYYALWITADGQSVELNNVTINSQGRAIAVKDEYRESASAAVKLHISDSKVTSAKKAAVLVTSKAGAAINVSNVDISGVAADKTNVVWVDGNSGYQNINNVTVTGGTAIVES